MGRGQTWQDPVTGNKGTFEFKKTYRSRKSQLDKDKKDLIRAIEKKLKERKGDNSEATQ